MHDAFTIGSLFSGVGLLDLAVERATGGVVRWQCEVDPWRRSILAKHWPDVERHADVRQLRSPPRVDLVCGGFPCQGLSCAGLRRGLDDERSGLWGEYARILGETCPALAFIENVPRLETAGLDRVLGDLDRLGYSTRRGLLAAEDVGAPHRRRRLWILAYADEVAIRQFAERLERVEAIGRDDVDRDSRVAVADADAGRLAELGEAHDHDRRHARGNDAARRGACPWPPGPDADAGAWDEWRRQGGRGPGVRRGAYGRAFGLDRRGRALADSDRVRRLAALGDAVCVPQAMHALRGLARGS